MDWKVVFGWDLKRSLLDPQYRKTNLRERETTYIRRQVRQVVPRYRPKRPITGFDICALPLPGTAERPNIPPADRIVDLLPDVMINFDIAFTSLTSLT